MRVNEVAQAVIVVTMIFMFMLLSSSEDPCCACRISIRSEECKSKVYLIVRKRHNDPVSTEGNRDAQDYE